MRMGTGALAHLPVTLLVPERLLGAAGTRGTKGWGCIQGKKCLRLGEWLAWTASPDSQCWRLLTVLGAQGAGAQGAHVAALGCG